MLPKQTICLTVFLIVNQWPFKKRVQILGLLWILLGNADFELLMKAQITQRRLIYLSFFLFFVNKIYGGYLKIIAIFNLVKIKNSKYIFGSSKSKVTFGFKYIIRYAANILGIPTFLFV